MATDESKRVRGPWLVIPLVALVAIVAAVFLTIQFSGRGAAKTNFYLLSFTAALRDVEEGYYKDAVKNLTKIIDGNANPVAYGWRGEAYARMEQYPEAEADFRRAVELEPNNPANQAGLADALAFQGKLEEALPHLDKAIEMHRSGGTVPPGMVRRWGDSLEPLLVRRTRLLQAIDRPEDARRDIEELKRLLNDDASPDDA